VLLKPVGCQHFNNLYAIGVFTLKENLIEYVHGYDNRNRDNSRMKIYRENSLKTLAVS